MKISVSDYLIKKLIEAGVKDVFGLPGDYNFNIVSAIEKSHNINWVGCCNELNAGYAADGYSRIKGLGAILTTWGVGELSAINAVAGAYSQSSALIKIVGIPDTKTLNTNRILHHSLSNSRWDMYLRAYENIAYSCTVLNFENAQEEIDEAFEIARINKKPVYLAIPNDVAAYEIEINEVKNEENEKTNKQALDYVLSALNNAKKPIILADSFVYSFRIEKPLENLINKLEIPSLTTMAGKGCICEENEFFGGTFVGILLNPKCKELFEQADLILSFGLIWSDFNSGRYSAKLDKTKTINITKNEVETPGGNFQISEPRGFIEELEKNVNSKKYEFIKNEKESVEIKEYISWDSFGQIFEKYLKEDDLIVSETGFSNLLAIDLKLKKGVKLLNQLVYASIGWAIPALLGVCTATPKQRTFLMLGDGAAQLSIQELSTISALKLKPVIFLFNNYGYSIERVLSRQYHAKFNDIAPWNYSQILAGFNCDAYYQKITKNEELNEFFKTAPVDEKICFLEISLPEEDMPLYVRNLAKLRGTI